MGILPATEQERNLLFSPKMMQGITANKDMISIAKERGEKVQIKSDDGELTAYKYEGIVYVTELKVCAE